jgi:hypothetical protein
MSFPVSPTNLQLAQVDGINYVYWSNSSAWFRQTVNNSSMTVGNLIVSGITKLGSSLTYTPQNGSLQVGSNFNNYVQISVQNANNGNNASTDLAAVADNGSDNDTYVDMGITSSTYNQTAYNLYGANDGYLIVSGNTTTNGGNLIINTYTNKDIIFAVGGTLTTNEVARVRANTNSFVINSSTISTNVNTGALIVRGGAGIAGDVNTGNVYAANVITTSGAFYANGVSITASAATTGKAIAMAMVFGG